MIGGRTRMGEASATIALGPIRFRCNVCLGVHHSGELEDAGFTCCARRLKHVPIGIGLGIAFREIGGELLRQQITAEFIIRLCQETEPAILVSTALMRPKTNRYVVETGRDLA
jgi:hypothetical protein